METCTGKKFHHISTQEKINLNKGKKQKYRFIVRDQSPESSINMRGQYLPN
jgi:3-methyladenine DNA glycosylase Mpg